jgi:flagellar basal-body rod protein FlgC
MPAIGVSATGIDAAQTWLDTTAGNIANVDDTAPLGQPVYQQQTPVFTPVAGVTGQGEGVAVSAIALGPAAGQVVEDPSSPQANAKGLVEQPAMSLSTQLVSLVTAQNDFEANATALERAVTAYQSALTLGS